jgi:hypothetical protein
VLALGSMVSPSVFLASYVLTYQQVPTFPPIGARNKIFYIGVAATLIGLFLDLLPQIKNYSKILAALLSLSTCRTAFGIWPPARRPCLSPVAPIGRSLRLGLRCPRLFGRGFSGAGER